MDKYGPGATLWTMFKVGSLYRIFMDDGDGTTERPNCRVEEVEGAVVKFSQAGREIIVNTASPKFIKAEPD